LLNTTFTLTEPLEIFSNNFNYLSLICIPDNKFILQLITENNTYVSVNINNAREGILESCKTTLVGDGTVSNPFRIYNIFQLNDLRNYLDGEGMTSPPGDYFTLEKDLDFSLINLSDFNHISGFEEYNIKGWKPISDYYLSTHYLFKDKFFDGENHTIKNLYINGYVGGDGCGLFGLASNSEFKNVYLEDVNINCSTNNIGGFLGYNRDSTSKLKNIGVTGIISGTAHVVGGVVGTCDGCDVENIYFVGDILCRNDCGGLFGTFYGSAENCYSSGNLHSNSDFLGGFSGRVGGNITNSYSTMNIYGGDKGGFIGGLTSGTISNSYSTGFISDGGDIGGFAGVNSGTITNVYYDKDTSGQSDNDGRGNPKTTNQMKDHTTFTGWDFDNIWAISPNINQGYPHLRNNSPK
jgi:hypothetical protein